MAASLVAADFVSEGDRWWSHIQYLADDSLQGRETASPGYRKAAEYVAGKMETFGLKPAGTDGYFQPVKLETRQVVEAESSLALVRDGNEEKLARAEATMSGRVEEGPVEAPMVFLGYGLDLKGVDLKGKVAVYVNAAGPSELPSALRAHMGSSAERWKALQAAGAIGVATIMNPRTGAGGLNAGAGGRGPGAGERGPQRVFLLADLGLRELVGQKVSVTITRAGGERFFAGSGHSYEEIIGLARENKPLPSFPLVGGLRAKTVVKSEGVEAPNVVGVLPGSDVRLKNEYVVMSAHLDHLGTGRPGAMDDASGIASILEIARIMQADGVKPRRSILFLAVTGEEKGELGSQYFARRPTVEGRQIVADINLDMFMPLFALRYVEVQGLAESTLGDAIRAAAKEYGVEVQADKEPEQNRFVRSDQYSFVKIGVPALAFKFGYEAGTPEDKIFHDWVKDRYHKAGDDLAQPMDRAAAAKFDRMIAGLLARVADAGERPSWRAESFFRRFEK